MTSLKTDLLFEQQKRIWQKAKRSAGPRYTSDLNVELPIKDIFEGIGRTDKFFAEIIELYEKLNDTFKSVSRLKSADYKDPIIKENIKKIKFHGEKLVNAALVLVNSRGAELNLNEVDKLATKASKYYYPITKAVSDFEWKEEQEVKKKTEEKDEKFLGSGQSEELRSLKSVDHVMRDFERATRDIQYLVSSTRAKLGNEPILLILGEAGIGKTHLMCDIARDRIKRNLPPTFIVLGEELLNIKDPLKSIMKACEIKGNKENFLKKLNRIGKSNQSRSLIIVDAINEADRVGWKNGLKDLIDEIKKYPWIGLIMTCRTPFHFLAMPKRLKVLTEWHQGFNEHELEAMSSFFKFYGLPLPEVPLMISEFSNPLFLSCFCKTASSIKGGKGKLARRLRDLAQGQVGMTKILEDFYINKEEDIVKKFNGKYKTVIRTTWIWSKSGDNCFIKRLAQEMASSGTRHVDNDTVLNVIAELSGSTYTKKTCQKIVNILIEYGILIKDLAWDGANRKYVDVIKFSFHKFSDHIIARYLLADFFDPNDINKSLSDNTPLGNIFKDAQSILMNIDIIEAIMVEFPERIKKIATLHEKDLVDFLPEKAINSIQFRQAYIRSLYWRVPKNFSNSKGEVKLSIRNYFNEVLLRYKNSSQEALNFLVAAAIKPLHPISYIRLDKFLSKMPMHGRDLFWSEFLREQYRCQSVYKLIFWIEMYNLKGIKKDQAEAVITVLGWTLTTTNRVLRDRASRCIYMIGKIHPQACFDVTQKMIEKNDPYIRERMIAACYGICMALNSNNATRETLPFAKGIYDKFFKKGAPYATTHILVRDYCKGIIEVALSQSPNLLTKAQIKRITPPYKDGGIRKWGRSKNKDKGTGNSPIHMDFENYTLGHLIPDRRNYDSGNKDFIKLIENILWRIYNLGWSSDKFKDVDREILNSSHPSRGDYIGKIDRYGKKYSWIAYYEMLGLRADRKQLYEYTLSEDQSRESSPEFDPSFPTYTHPRTLLFKKNLISGPRALKKWMVQEEIPDIENYFEVEEIDGEKGPWVLMHGSIGHDNTALERRTSVFIEGITISEKTRHKLEEFFEKTEYPGNDHIPDLPDINSLFAGEIGWKDMANLNNKDYEKFIRIYQGSKKKKIPKRASILQSIRIAYFEDNEKTTFKAPTPKVPEYFDVPIYENLKVEMIARWFSSKDYAKLGEENGLGIHIPNKKIMKLLKLKYRPDTFDFNDRHGKIAAISRFSGNQYGTHENLLYMRKDLVDAYIKIRKKKFNLLVWGERQFWPKGMDDFHRKDLQPIYQSHKNIFKKVIYY